MIEPRLKCFWKFAEENFVVCFWVVKESSCMVILLKCPPFALCQTLFVVQNATVFIYN